MSKHPSVLTLDVALVAVAALRELHRVCLAMDLECQDARPAEEEYQAAMRAAKEALARWPNVEFSGRR